MIDIKNIIPFIELNNTIQAYSVTITVAIFICKNGRGGRGTPRTTHSTGIMADDNIKIDVANRMSLFKAAYRKSNAARFAHDAKMRK